MNMNMMKKRLSCILCSMLIVAMALFTTGCNGTDKSNTAADTATVEEAQTEASTEEGQAEDEQSAAMVDGEELGEGNTQFTFSVTDPDGKEISVEIHTDETTVGAALVALGLIEGEDSEYGLYVKTVNGTTLDYDADGSYWAFYINDEYAQTGVDATDIEEGNVYSFRAE
jgi:uncharacterized protein YxeA